MRRAKILSILASSIIIVTLITSTYAYFKNEQATNIARNVIVTTEKTCNLSFETGSDISLIVTASDFNSATRENAIAESFAKAELNGDCSDNYYVYLKIKKNEIDYIDKENNMPELLLTVKYYEDDIYKNDVTSLAVDGTNLIYYNTQNALNGVTGFDITGLGNEDEVLIPIANYHSITASDSITHRWDVTITFINHDINQNNNSDKIFTSELIIQHNEIGLSFDKYLINKLYNNSSQSTLYYHNTGCSNNCAEDESYRYAGPSYNLTEKAINEGYTHLYKNSDSDTNYIIGFYCSRGSEYSDMKNLSSCKGYTYYFYAGYDPNNTRKRKESLYEIQSLAYEDGYLSDNINNWVCFGYDRDDLVDTNVNNIPDECESATFATSDYAYRIIGLFKDVDGNNANYKYYVKLIKATEYIG